MSREEPFQILARSARARAGEFKVAHGSFQTPAFMPVGTQASVKGVLPRDLEEIGSEIILTNTYHLHLRPGDELIRDCGGIHAFMNWPGPILSDSGGFQVFSLARLNQVTDEGVVFQSHIDGQRILFTPESVVRIQENLGVDIMMVLDECLPPAADKAAAQCSWKRTLRWAERSLAAKQRSDVLAFGIVQGGMFSEAREQAARDLAELPFDAYAVGGVSVGEALDDMRRVTEISAAALPESKLRYLMGVGTPLDLVQSVALGIDLFDCVIPTRSARFGRLYVANGSINIRNQCYRRDPRPIDESCDCYACRNFSRAYISHLIHAKEVLAVCLASLHNLRFYQRLMKDIRESIHKDCYTEFCECFSAAWEEGSEVDGKE